MLQSIEKRAEFIKSNDAELLKLLSSLTNSESLNAPEGAENAAHSHQEIGVYVSLDVDFVPFIEQIKLNIRDVLAYEAAFKTQSNFLLAKENLLDKFFERKSANANLNLGGENQHANEISNENFNANFDTKNNFDYFKLNVAEKNYYNEKFNKIIYYLNQIKQLREKKESKYLSSLKPSSNNASKSSESSAAAQANNANQAAVNKHLEEMKVYIYSRFDSLEKFYLEISKYLRLNFNRIEDFENLKFESADAKQNLLRNLERKIRELANYRNMTSENKQLLQFYKNFFAYAEQKQISLSGEVILSEDMLNYIENPDFLLKRKIEEADYLGKARDYFKDAYAAKTAQRRLPSGSLFVLENLDFLKNNMQVDLENYAIRSFDDDNNSNSFSISNNDKNSLKSKIEYYQKNLEFVKLILAKIPDLDLHHEIDDSNRTINNYNNSSIVNYNKNDLLLKKLILFESENSAKSNYNYALASTENKPNHLIEAYLKSFSSRISKKMISRQSSGQAAKTGRYPFKALNEKNLFKFLFTQNSDNPRAQNVLSSIAEKVIVPAVNAPKIAVCRNVLKQLQNLEQAVKGRRRNYDEDFAVNELFAELLKRMNISFNKATAKSAEALKLKEMKDVIDQNFEVFDVEHCVYMIQFGVENNIADGIFIIFLRNFFMEIY